MLRIATTLLFYILLALVGARPTNVTVDDADVRFVYAPADRWTQGATCATCGVASVMDAAQAYNRTWHDTTAVSPADNVSVTLAFAGSAVYVYAMLANGVPGNEGVTTATNLSFVLDGEHVGDYMHTSNSSGIVQYDVPVYVKTSMRDGNHTLVILPTAGSIANADHSLFLFDYAVYTTGTSPAAGPSAAAIVGAAVGGVLGLTVLGLVLALLWLRRRRHRARHPFALASQASPPASRDAEAPPQYTRATESASTAGSPDTLDAASASHAATWSHTTPLASSAHASVWTPDIARAWTPDAASASHASAWSHYGPARAPTPVLGPSGKAPLPPPRGLQVDTSPLPLRAGEDPSPLTAVMRPHDPATGDVKVAPRRALPLPPGARKLVVYNDTPG